MFSQILRLNYNEGACRQTRFTEINRFSPKLLEWEQSIQIKHEIENLNGCELVLLITKRPPATDFNLNANGDLTALGYAVDFFETLSKFNNFTIIYKTVDDKTNTTPTYEILARAESMIVYDFQKNNNKSDTSEPSWNGQYSLSKTFITTKYCFVIPQGELYTPLEKMFLPFDIETWTWILIFITVGVVVIVIIKFMPTVIQKFVFGRDVNTPLLNMTRAFFGIGQIILPGRNFARYHLMLFMLFCLIIRTAYQSKMFEFLQKEMRKPEVKTIEDMIEKNFTFHVTKTQFIFLNSSETFHGFVPTLIYLFVFFLVTFHSTF